MRKRIELEITPGACIGLAVLLLILPLRWVCAAVLAGAVHELWHCLAIHVCKGRVYSVRIGAGKAQLETSPMQQLQELVCAAAGPIGSFSLLLAAKWIPATAICGLIQGLFNLLPVFPLDGGRVMRSGIQILFPGRTSKISEYAESGGLILVLGFCIYGMIRLGMWLLFIPVTSCLLMKLLYEKNSLQRSETGGTIEIH